MKNLLTLSSLISLSVAAAGCGNAQDGLRQAASGIANMDLNHTWLQEKCAQNVAEKILGGSSRTSYNFSGASFSRTVQIYSNTDCTNPSAAITYSGNYRSGEVVQKDVRQLDLAYAKVTVVAQNADALKLMNTPAGFCGKSDWAVNTPVDLTAQAGSGVTCALLSKTPQTNYTIYTVTNDRLYLGKSGDQVDPAKRPTEIDAAEGFAKN